MRLYRPRRVSSRSPGFVPERRARVQLEAFDRALKLAVEKAGIAFQSHDGWVDAIRAGLVALLEFFDERPVLARYLVIDSAQAGSAVQTRRAEVLDRAAMLLDDERAPGRAYPPPLAARAVASGVLGVLHAQLSQPDPGALADLAGPLMSFTVLPFLGQRAARRERRRPDEASVRPVCTAVEQLQDPGRRLNHHREIAVLKVLATEPRMNNRDLALRVGVRDQGQISRLLARLARLGLIENAARSGATGEKAWQLTSAGKQLETALAHETRDSGAGTVLDLPDRFAGRLDYWAVCVLRAVAEQAWLTNAELAVRAGLGEPARISALLAQLQELGLVDSEREPHRRGTPKVWRITDAGSELDKAIGHKDPAAPRSLALDLMWQSGGRLSENALAVLNVCAEQPGLNNSEIGTRVGIGDQNSVSQLLARLLRRGLIANARAGGRHNIWRLTASGEALECAIRNDAPVAADRTVALELLTDRGGRLNHRVVTVLRLIGEEPGLSNLEIGQRIGVQSKGHVSRVLSRLARFGLIENQVLDPVPFEGYAWRLTPSGQALDAAIPADRTNSHLSHARQSAASYQTNACVALGALAFHSEEES